MIQLLALRIRQITQLICPALKDVTVKHGEQQRRNGPPPPRPHIGGQSELSETQKAIRVFMFWIYCPLDDLRLLDLQGEKESPASSAYSRIEEIRKPFLLMSDISPATTRFTLPGGHRETSRGGIGWQ